MPLITHNIDNINDQMSRKKIDVLKNAIIKIAEIKDSIEYFYKKNDDGTIIEKITEIEELKNFFGGSFLNDAHSLVENKSKIDAIYTHLSSILQLLPELENIKEVAKKKNTLNEISKRLKEIDDIRTDLCITVERSKAFAMRSKDSYDNTVILWRDKIDPQVTKLENDLVDLKNETITIKGQIENSHENALKFFQYEHVINVQYMCYECSPNLVIDDVNHKIIWNIPKPICATRVEADPNIVKDSVDAYLATLPNTSNVDENITVDDLESLVGSIKVSMLDGDDNLESFTFDLTKRSTEDNLFYTYGSYSSNTEFKTITGLPLGDYKIIGTSIPLEYYQANIDDIYTINENTLNIDGIIRIEING